MHCFKMLDQTSLAACSINLLLATGYYFSRKSNTPPQSLFIQCSGIAITSIFNGARSLSNKELENWFDRHQLDYIHGSISILVIGFADYYGNIPLKTNLLCTLFFTSTQAFASKFSNYLFQEAAAD